ncbi:MAG: hypothetical protein RLZ49_605, partial [Actinomycetota bacterium]
RLRTLQLTEVDLVPTVSQPVFIGDKNVGYVTSAEFGWSVGAPVALAWLPIGTNEGDKVSISCGGRKVSAVVMPDAVFDPTGSRIRI